MVPSQSVATMNDVENLKHSESAASLDSATPADSEILKACDCVLWAGDFNFRVDMPYQEVINHCQNEAYSKILEKDEFRILHKKTGDRYSDFQEGEINFPPTYKFDLRPGKDGYVKNRVPAYTDRILFRDRPQSRLECTQYTSIENVIHSDHKPVIAHFRLKLKPGLHTGNPSYGKFNQEVYKRGCQQRERHHSLGVGFDSDSRRRQANVKSTLCVLQ